MVRRLVGVLVIGSGVVAILLGTWFAFSVPEPELRLDIRFEASRPAYIVGEWVTIHFENRGDISLCTVNMIPFSVQRLVGGEWMRVDSHSVLNAVWRLEIGDVWELPWLAKSDPDWERLGLAEVLPGEYRARLPGWLCLAPSHDRIEPGNVELLAPFELV